MVDLLRAGALAGALIAIGAISGLLALAARPARAASDQLAILEDDGLLQSNPRGTLAQLRSLGVRVVRLSARWQQIAPEPNSRRRPHFDAGDPGAYPARNWSSLDTIITLADQLGIRIDLDATTGAPMWATGPSPPRYPGKVFHQWEPSARQFGLFVHALATRYSGRYLPPGASSPLPRVSFWSVWNEPNYGPSLAPQGVYPNHLTVENSPRIYRGLLDAAWNALQATGHGSDTVLFGELAPRGLRSWGVFSGMKPLIFLRALYCLDPRYRPLRGVAAAQRGCPTSTAGSRRFPAAHPALFHSSGFSDHPYMRWYRPDRERHPDPDYSSLAEIGRLKAALDRSLRAYGSGVRLPIYDTEFGYITSPPNVRTHYDYVSPDRAAYFINWAEYISWRDPRIKSYAQYLLRDPPEPANGSREAFASGLRFHSGRPKPELAAFRLPLYLPRTRARGGEALEVWGCARPSYFARLDDPGTPQSVRIEFAPGSSRRLTALRTVPITDPGGYFDVRVAFPSSGTVTLSYTYPSGRTISSRAVHVSVG